mgnify:CR=1 FL=1
MCNAFIVDSLEFLINCNEQKDGNASLQPVTLVWHCPDCPACSYHCMYWFTASGVISCIIKENFIVWVFSLTCRHRVPTHKEVGTIKTPSSSNTKMTVAFKKSVIVFSTFSTLSFGDIVICGSRTKRGENSNVIPLH